MFKHAGFPIICFDRPFPGQTLPTVLGDNYGGPKRPPNTWCEMGSSESSAWAATANSSPARGVRGYRDVMQAANLPCLADLNVQDYASAEAALQFHLHGSNRIDAIFSIKNAITVNAYKILRQATIDIPGSVALIGYDDFELADALEPPICVVRQPVVDIATRAAEMIFEALEKGEEKRRTLTLKVELVHRRSCSESRSEGRSEPRYPAERRS